MNGIWNGLTTDLERYYNGLTLYWNKYDCFRFEKSLFFVFIEPLHTLTSVRRIQCKRISDAELTIIFRKAQQAKGSSQSTQSLIQ